MKADQVEVIIRIRPSQHLSEIRHVGNTIGVPSTTYDRKERFYQFSQVFGTNATNNEIWEEAVSGYIDEVKAGRNLTLLTYGVTGSGKTHTVFGNTREQGIAFMVFKTLFEQSPESEFKFSFLQIYNQNIRDLLSDDQDSKVMLLQQKNVTSMVNLIEVPVHSYTDLVTCIELGMEGRAEGFTSMNENSSRSHAILQLQMTNSKSKTKSKISIIDLAGSEKTFYNETSKTMMQGSNINKSLLALGNCLSILSDSSKKGNYIPYRDSKLTRVLKDSLSGNSRLIMIACVSNNPVQFEETQNTIQYASRASKIKFPVKKQKPEQCCSCGSRQRLLSNLRDIERLESKLQTVVRQIGLIDLDQLQRKVEVAWNPKLNEAKLTRYPLEVSAVNKHNLLQLIDKYRCIQSSVLSTVLSTQGQKENLNSINLDLSIFSKRTSTETFLSQQPSQEVVTRRMKRDFDECNKIRLRVGSPLTLR